MDTASLPEEDRLSYGWLKFRPRWLQFLNTAKWFLFFLSQYFFTQSFVINGLYPGIASTLEKRFAFSSYKIGMMLSSYEIATMIVTPVVSFFGGSRKKPVFCGWGLFTMAVGFFIFTLPHFISSPYKARLSTDSNGTGDVQHVLCAGNHSNSGGKTECAVESHGESNLYYALFILGMIVAGIGNSPLYALGVPYLDQNVKKKVSPMYLGFFVGFGGILGAAAGFVLSSFFLSLFVETGVQTSLTPRDTLWIGNWWLGFAILGGFGAFWSVWLFGFPKEFPLTKTRREEDNAPEDSSNSKAGYTKLKDLPKATKLVFSRLPFVFITIGGCMESLTVTSITAFGPKILESQYYVPAGRTALLYGLVTVLVALFGNMLGAYINKRLNLSRSGAAKMCFIAASIGFVFSSLLYIKCDVIGIAGVNKPYVNSSSAIQLEAKCNQACNCTRIMFDPVCGGPLTYFSPCHAGCGEIEHYHNKTSTSFKSCTCVESKSDPTGEVEKGACPANCGLKLVLFLLVLSTITLMTFVNDTPALIVTLRSVPVGQQPYALGLQSDLVKILGTIPGPIILGALIDKACILWDRRCGEKGFCLEYDHGKLALVVLGVIMTCKFITTATFFFSLFFSRREDRHKDDKRTTQETNLQEIS